MLYSNVQGRSPTETSGEKHGRITEPQIVFGRRARRWVGGTREPRRHTPGKRRHERRETCRGAGREGRLDSMTSQLEQTVSQFNAAQDAYDAAAAKVAECQGKIDEATAKISSLQGRLGNRRLPCIAKARPRTSTFSWVRARSTISRAPGTCSTSSTPMMRHSSTRRRRRRPNSMPPSRSSTPTSRPRRPNSTTRRRSRPPSRPRRRPIRPSTIA